MSGKDNEVGCALEMVFIQREETGHRTNDIEHKMQSRAMIVERGILLPVALMVTASVTFSDLIQLKKAVTRV